MHACLYIYLCSVRKRRVTVVRAFLMLEAVAGGYVQLTCSLHLPFVYRGFDLVVCRRLVLPSRQGPSQLWLLIIQVVTYIFPIPDTYSHPISIHRG